MVNETPNCLFIFFKNEFPESPVDNLAWASSHDIFNQVSVPRKHWKNQVIIYKTKNSYIISSYTI